MKVHNAAVQTSQYIIFKSMAQGLLKCSCPAGKVIPFLMEPYN